MTCGRGWPGGSPTRPCSSHRRQRRSWTATSRTWRTRSDPSSWNASWTRRSPRSCPTWPRSAGWRRPTAGTSPSSSSRSPTPAPRGARRARPGRRPRPRTSRRRVRRQLKDLGSEDSLDVRRAAAVGELARHQLALDLTTPVVEEGAPRPSRNHHAKRQVVLYVHLSRAALEGIGTARLEQGNQLVTAGQVRDWCGTAGTRGREAGARPRGPRPGRHRRRPRTGTPRSPPSGTRPASSPGAPGPPRRCDTDHTIPAARGGPTCPCNSAPLCRRHHRIKTHGGWTYTTLEPGHYLWTSKHGYQYLRDPDGTLDVSRDRHRPPD